METRTKGLLLALGAWIGLTILAALGFFLIRGFNGHAALGAVVSIMLVVIVAAIAGLRSLFSEE